MRLNGIYTDEGTILGPTRNGDYICVRAVHIYGVECDYATHDDVERARYIITRDGPRSITERNDDNIMGEW